MSARFALGKVVITPAASEVLLRAGQDPGHFLQLHVEGKWGDVCREDRQANDAAIANEADPERRGRVLSAYLTRNSDRIWVITEHDRSVTTILRPDDY